MERATDAFSGNQRIFASTPGSKLKINIGFRMPVLKVSGLAHDC